MLWLWNAPTRRGLGLNAKGISLRLSGPQNVSGFRRYSCFLKFRLAQATLGRLRGGKLLVRSFQWEVWTITAEEAPKAVFLERKKADREIWIRRRRLWAFWATKRSLPTPITFNLPPEGVGHRLIERLVSGYYIYSWEVQRALGESGLHIVYKASRRRMSLSPPCKVQLLRCVAARITGSSFPCTTYYCTDYPSRSSSGALIFHVHEFLSRLIKP